MLWMKEVAVLAHSTSLFLCFAGISKRRSCLWIRSWSRIFWEGVEEKRVYAAERSLLPEATGQNTARPVQKKQIGNGKQGI